MSRNRKLLLAAVIVPLQVTTAWLARRDLARRSDEQLRGSRRFWRRAILLNPGNAAFYWAFGRR